MSALSPDQVVTLTELLVLLMGIGITWAVYRGSEEAELPGDARIPDPNQTDDAAPDTHGRSFS